MLYHGSNHHESDLEGYQKVQGISRNSLWVGNSHSDDWILPLGGVACPQSDG